MQDDHVNPSLRKQLHTVATLYCQKMGHKSLKTVSRKIFNDSGTLDGLAEGTDVTTRSWEKAIVWFAERWPPRTRWPKGVKRPRPFIGVAG